MPKVRAYATMHNFLEWEGEIPDNIPEDERYLWVKENVDGSSFTDTGNGEWVWGVDVDVIEDEEIDYD